MDNFTGETGEVCSAYYYGLGGDPSFLHVPSAFKSPACKLPTYAHIR